MTASKRILVGLSGGIDSSVAACLLQEAGYEVIGVTLRLRECTAGDGSRRSCCGPDAAGMAGAVARQLGIRHYVLDCYTEFDEQVLRPCWEAFAAGRTPNPCILCNERVRFPKLLELAGELSACAVATGHYACIEPDPEGPLRLLRGVDRGKDQSYFLYSVAASSLSRIRFPLGRLRKEQVRGEARRRSLLNAERAESQDVCVTGAEGGFAEVLRIRFGAEAVRGVVQDREGRTLGRHEGIHTVTRGQRRGLGVAAGVPVRVCSVDPGSGIIRVSSDPSDLLSETCLAVACRWQRVPPPLGFSLSVQIRYQQEPVFARVEELGPGAATVRVRFASPVSAVTPGQALVLYKGDAVVGGGVIASV